MKTELKIFLGLILFLGITMSTIKISNSGLDKLKRSEALRLKPYLDSAGKWTIGWGHLIKLPSENYLLDKDGISEAQATELLRQDLATAEDSVNRLVEVPLNGNQFDALVSFVYNVGSGAFRDSTLLKVLNAGDYSGAASQFARWRYAGGLINAGLEARRERERTEFIA